MTRAFLYDLYFLAILFLSPSLHAQVLAEVTNKTFPFPSAEMATISSVVFSSAVPASLIRIKTSNPQRQEVLSLKNRGFMKSVLWRGRPGQPMVFLVPGMGGTSTTGNLNDLARIFQSWGYHAVTFNNPMHWQFALTYSADGVPGFFPEDAQLFYQNMLSVQSQLKKKFHLEYTKTILVCYSLGCQYAPELLRIDHQKKAFEFSELIMISPLLDIAYAIDKYDHINKVGGRQVPNSEVSFYGFLRGRLIVLFETMLTLMPTQPVSYFYENYPFTNQQGEILIGGSFKDSLEEILYVTSLVHPERKKFFKSPISTFHREARYAEIRKFSFGDYFHDFVLQKDSLRQQYLTSEKFLSSFSLMGEMAQLRRDPRIKVILSEDDPISRRKDIANFAEAFGDRAMVLKHGGHAGFFWFPGFAVDLRSFLNP